jgi:enoyl-CoA hydratase
VAFQLLVQFGILNKDNLMKFKNINVRIENDIAFIEMNRPGKYNALSADLFKELKELLLDIKKKPNVARGAILYGSGEKAFAAGADIKQMSQMNKQDGKAFSQLAQEVTLILEKLPIPVIAAVDGFALGGGCELAMACDFIYATEKSQFGQPEVTLGLIPGFGGCVRFVRLLGIALAKEYIYTARQISATEALSLNLVNKVLKNRKELFVKCIHTLNEIFANSKAGVTYSKLAINQALGLSTKEGLLKERIAFSKAFTHEDKVEGVSAFLEKRKANFH